MIGFIIFMWTFFCHGKAPLSFFFLSSWFHFYILIKLRWALLVTYTIIQSITSSEMCSLYLTHPSAHTLVAVDTHTHTWSSGHTHTPGAVDTHTHTPGAVDTHTHTPGAVGGSVPCSRVSLQSWTIPAGAKIRTHNLGLQVQRSIH